MNILFLCAENSTRGLMAAGIAQKLFGERVRSKSAVPTPCAGMHPWLLESMREVGVDIQLHSSESVRDLDPKFLASLDYVITFNRDALELPTNATHLYWPTLDPVADAENTQLNCFRLTRETLEGNIRKFGQAQGWV